MGLARWSCSLSSFRRRTDALSYYLSTDPWGRPIQSIVAAVGCRSVTSYDLVVDTTKVVGLE